MYSALCTREPNHARRRDGPRAPRVRERRVRDGREVRRGSAVRRLPVCVLLLSCVPARRLEGPQGGVHGGDGGVGGEPGRAGGGKAPAAAPERVPTASQRATGAAQGEAEALWLQGVCNYYGEGAPQSYERAVELYQRAADQGHAGAQAYLGDLYRNGLGMPRDAARAIALYRQAAAGAARLQLPP